jgi:hypothetical protein
MRRRWPGRQQGKAVTEVNAESLRRIRHEISKSSARFDKAPADLFANARDENFHRVGYLVIQAIDVLDEFRLRDDLTAPMHQIGNKPIFERRKIDRNTLVIRRPSRSLPKPAFSPLGLRRPLARQHQFGAVTPSGRVRPNQCRIGNRNLLDRHIFATKVETTQLAGQVPQSKSLLPALRSLSSWKSRRWCFEVARSAAALPTPFPKLRAKVAGVGKPLPPALSPF